MFLLSLFLTLFAHDYHISKTNLRYVAERQQLQVEMHLFVDDVELAMMDAGAPRLDLGTEAEHPEAARYVTAYLDKHFKIDWNGTTVRPKLLGWELEDDLHGIWLYLAADLTEEPETVTVTNSILTEFYADQRNIVKLFNGEERVATFLTARDRKSDYYGR